MKCHHVAAKSCRYQNTITKKVCAGNLERFSIGPADVFWNAGALEQAMTACCMVYRTPMHSYNQEVCQCAMVDAPIVVVLIRPASRVR